MIRIGILGIGGVGGYIGGYLTEKYAKSSGYEIVFIARGEHADAIKVNGLKICLDDETKIVYPNLVSNNPIEVGKLDYLICATKSYDLDNALNQFEACIDENTTIVPLLNGVDSFSKLSKHEKFSKVLNGCIFIVSKILEPGTIQINGTNHYVVIGSEKFQKEANELNEILERAHIKVKRVENVNTAVWEKYIFIASLATITSGLDKTIGQILENEIWKNDLILLMQEVKNLAEAQRILIQEKIIEKSISSMEKMPYETTSSMHRDKRAGKLFESNSLSKFVVELGEQLHVETPTFKKYIKLL